MPWGGLRRQKGPARMGDLVAAVDIGSSKVCCLIARIEDGTPRIIGIGHHASRGVRNGTIIDIEAAQLAIGSAIQTAEQMAGETLRFVWSNLCGGQPTSHTMMAEVNIGGDAITGADVARIRTQGQQNFNSDTTQLIHSIPVNYIVDGNRGIRDPRGMYAQTLAAQIHLITTPQNAIRNLITCIERNHLGVSGWAVGSYVGGLACLVEDEMDLGVTVIDMGGGTTTFAVFSEGQAVYTDGVSVGGQHVTSDIARGLSTSLAYAERLKTLYGNAISDPGDERELINVPLVGEEDPSQAVQIPKSMLASIIRPRLEELFELVREKLESTGADQVAGRRVVLTGGGCQLPGVRELAQLTLEKQVRLGRPLRVLGLPEGGGGPAFSTAAGLLLYAIRSQTESVAHQGQGFDSLLGQFGQWLRENL